MAFALMDFQRLHCKASSDLAIASEPICGSVFASCECPGLSYSLPVSIPPMLRCFQARSKLSLPPLPDSMCNTQSLTWYAKLNRVGCLSACCSAYAKVGVWVRALLCFPFTQLSFLALTIVAFGCGFQNQRPTDK